MQRRMLPSGQVAATGGLQVADCFLRRVWAQQQSRRCGGWKSSRGHKRWTLVWHRGPEAGGRLARSVKQRRCREAGRTSTTLLSLAVSRAKLPEFWPKAFTRLPNSREKAGSAPPADSGVRAPAAETGQCRWWWGTICSRPNRAQRDQQPVQRVRLSAASVEETHRLDIGFAVPCSGTCKA